MMLEGYCNPNKLMQKLLLKMNLPIVNRLGVAPFSIANLIYLRLLSDQQPCKLFGHWNGMICVMSVTFIDNIFCSRYLPFPFFRRKPMASQVISSTHLGLAIPNLLGSVKPAFLWHSRNAQVLGRIPS